jgi:hypothetical protein
MSIWGRCRVPDDKQQHDRYVNYEVHNPRLENLLAGASAGLLSVLPEGYGFTLMLFGYEDRQQFFYASSAVREDMIKAMEELVERLKGERTQ